jgi:hypothetical protein
VSCNLIHVGGQHARRLPRKGVDPADYNCNSSEDLTILGVKTASGVWCSAVVLDKDRSVIN